MIGDLGISQPDGVQVVQISATPGFGAPEQVAGKPHKKSDNHSMGKIIGLLFCDWDSGFIILWGPVDQNLQNEITKFKNNNDPFRCDAYNILSGLLKVKQSHCLTPNFLNETGFKVEESGSKFREKKYPPYLLK